MTPSSASPPKRRGVLRRRVFFALRRGPILVLLLFLYGLGGLGLLIAGVVEGDSELIAIGLVLVLSYGIFFVGAIDRVRNLFGG